MAHVVETIAMKTQRGFTLIELMVGLLVGFIVVATAFAMYGTSVHSSAKNIQAARLHHELQQIMDVMVNDIRRAGYNSLAGNGSANPFTGATTDLRVVDYGPATGCVLYSFDSDSDGVVDANEYLGFKRSLGSGPNFAIWMRQTGTTTANCADGSWDRVSDERAVVIDRLRFTTTNSKCKAAGTVATLCTSAQGWNAATLTAPTVAGNYVVVRHLIIELVGHMASDPSISKVITASVKIRNDRLVSN